jgi:hypothetical protein
MAADGTFVPENVYRLWGVMILISIAANIGGVIVTQIISAIIYRIRTNQNKIAIAIFVTFVTIYR